MGGSPSSVKEDGLLKRSFSRPAPSGLVCISRARLPARALFQLGTPQHPRGLSVSTGPYQPVDHEDPHRHAAFTYYHPQGVLGAPPNNLLPIVFFPPQRWQ